VNKSRTWNGDLIMDTDDLTEMAYESILIANEITEFLKCDLGVPSKDYKNEDAYLNGMLRFVSKIKDDPAGYLDSWNLLEELDMAVFKKGIEELEKHIKKTIETPIAQRGASFHS
jgi:hypothetical protein